MSEATITNGEIITELARKNILLEKQIKSLENQIAQQSFHQDEIHRQYHKELDEWKKKYCELNDQVIKEVKDQQSRHIKEIEALKQTIREQDKIIKEKEELGHPTKRRKVL